MDPLISPRRPDLVDKSESQTDRQTSEYLQPCGSCQSGGLQNEKKRRQNDCQIFGSCQRTEKAEDHGGY